MEPAIELAVRITAHLWILRHVFPRALGMADLDQQNADPDHGWPKHLLAAAKKDHALAARILDLTPVLGTGSPNRDSFDGVKRGVSRYEATPLGKAVEDFVRHLGGSPPTESSAPFPPRDLLRFRNWDRGGMDCISRDEVIDDLANWLLANPADMPAIADTLAYQPTLAEVLRHKGTGDGAQPADVAWADPETLLAAADEAGVAVPFSIIQREELQEIEDSRARRLTLLARSALAGGSDLDNGPSLALPVRGRRQVASQQASQMELFGIALSGGGIRSATFSLGILQALADRHLLTFADYLSTVSGGGYIGSWLLAWVKRRGSILSVEKSLQGYSTDLSCDSAGSTYHSPCGPPAITRNTDPMSEDVRPIRYLRTYSSYLAPETGIFSADTWTIVATWMRNMTLNLLVLIPFLAAALLLPRMVAFLLVKVPLWIGSVDGLFVIGAAFILGATWFIAANIQVLYKVRPPGIALPESGDSDGLVLSSIVSLVLIGVFFSIDDLWIGGGYREPIPSAVAATGLYLAGVLILYFRLRNADNEQQPMGVGFLALAVSATAGGLLIFVLCQFVLQALAGDSQRGTWIVVTTGGALVIGILTIVVVMFIGITGSSMSDKAGEWWSRLGAWLNIVVLAWLILASISFFVPLWIARASAALVAGGGITWTAITTAGVKLAAGAKSGKNGDSSLNTFTSLILNAAPYVFMIGLFSVISFALFWLTGALLSQQFIAETFKIDAGAHALCCADSSLNFQRMVDNYWTLMYPGSWVWFWLMVLFFAVSLIFASRIDINEFSMQNFYKNRLVRAYLGASRLRQHRWPNAFTSFDPDDDLPLSRFRHCDESTTADEYCDCSPGFTGPFPVINTALNITRGEDPSREERKAASFVFTPFRSGFDFTRKQTGDPGHALSEYAFRPTYLYGDPTGLNRKKKPDPAKPSKNANGISVGNAIATSGAAANPNAGFHTSPSLAFLLTVFNVRLGRWMGNPRSDKFWRRSSPGMGLFYLLSELFGQTQVDSSYVQLSDGGHFDNMGLYELIRRRCKYIVVCDGEEDSGFVLEGIGGAIRKCRVDFGVVISLDLTELVPAEKTKLSTAHYAVGTILYPGECECGTLVYIKSSLTGDESVDLKEFGKKVPAFPNESTLNQFFDESHFESYRALGQHIGQQIFQCDGAAFFRDTNYDLAATLHEVFEKIRRNPSAGVPAAKLEPNPEVQQ